MIKRIALPFLVLLGSCGSSLAAEASNDWSHDWSGFYLGVDAGWARNGGSVASAYNDGVYPSRNDDFPDSFDSDGGSFSGGVLAGYNRQSGNLVTGFEADINYLGYDASAGHFVGIGANTHLDASADWYGTLRGRLGFASDRLMVYGTGGLAFGETELSASVVDATSGITYISGADSTMRVGWAAGAGLEFAIDDRWSAGAEYLHVDLDSMQVGDQQSSLSVEANGDFAFDVLRATLKYSLR